MREKKTRWYRELGEKLRELREVGGHTQDAVANELKRHVNTIASFERGTHRPDFEFLIQFRKALQLEEDEWKELTAIYEIVIERVIDPKAIPPVAHSSLVLDDERDRIERLDCLKPFYEHRHTYHPPDHINSRLLNRIFAFSSLRPVPVITGIDGEQSSGPPLWSGADQRAARLLEEMLRTLKIRSQFLNQPEDPLPKADQSSMVLVAGPRRSDLSHEINQIVSTQEWFSGFYFSNENPDYEWGWTVRHRALNELSIAMADICDMTELPEDGRPPYRKLQDGQVQDFGVVYAGPNPSNVKHWLVLAAGLRGMGSIAAARALTDPTIVELIGHQLLLRRRYVSALVRYRFQDLDQTRLQGVISSICLTTGTVPEN